MFHKTSKKNAACSAQAHLDLRTTRRSVSLLYGIVRKVSSPRLTLRKARYPQQPNRREQPGHFAQIF
jgi:hypothetical protein